MANNKRMNKVVNQACLGMATVLCWGLAGCFHPVSTMFESAYSLEPGESKLIVAGTVNPESPSSYSGGSLLGIVDVGLTSSTDVRFRLEQRLESGEYANPYSFFEVAPKWTSKSGTGFAFSLPVQLYIPEEDDAVTFVNPRFIWTRRLEDGVSELTGVLHAQVGLIDDVWGAIPGLAVGVALRDNQPSKPATRLELGVNIHGQVTLGGGVQLSLGKKPD
jgi:hypothetical protein